MKDGRMKQFGESAYSDCNRIVETVDENKPTEPSGKVKLVLESLNNGVITELVSVNGEIAKPIVEHRSPDTVKFHEQPSTVTEMYHQIDSPNDSNDSDGESIPWELSGNSSAIQRWRGG